MKLLERITSPDPSVRNLSFDSWADGQPENELLAEAVRLESFRRESQNLYDRVRALIFLATLHRFQLGAAATGTALIPYQPVVKVPILRIGESGKKPRPTDALQRILSGQLTIWYPRKRVSNRHSGRIPT